MELELLEILESFDVPVYRQGSQSNEDSYAPTFITYWNNNSDDLAVYDNDEHGTAWSYTVIVYSTDPDLRFTLLADVRAALKAAGWIPQSKGYDVASDEATHTARGLDVIFPDWRTKE